MIGAGSVVFAKNLLGDILSNPELAQSEIALMDIDPERLRVAEIVTHRVAGGGGGAAPPPPPPLPPGAGRPGG